MEPGKKNAMARAKTQWWCFIMDFPKWDVWVRAEMFTNRARQLCEGIVGEQEVLEALTATDLLIYHLQVVLGHIQVH